MSHYSRLQSYGVFIFSYFYKNSPSAGKNAGRSSETKTESVNNAAAASFEWLDSVCWIGAFAIGGTAARYGLVQASDEAGITATDKMSQGSVVFDELVPNMLGSFIMGVFAGCKKELAPRFPAIYTGITTGFCGCLTTFSSWIYATAVLYGNGKIWRALICTSVGFGCPWAALCLGFDLGQVASTRLSWTEKGKMESSSDETKKSNRRVEGTANAIELGSVVPSSTKIDGPSSSVDPAADSHDRKYAPSPVRCGFFERFGPALCSVLIVIFLVLFAVDIADERHSKAEVYLALCIAPAFALLRYVSSAWNRNHETFPLYTLLANLTGALLSTLCARLVASDEVDATRATEVFLNALSLGGAGCLSTVSTFVNEVRILPRPFGTRYAFVTIVLGQLVSVSIVLLFRGAIDDEI